MGILLENKVPQKSEFLENFFSKSWSPNTITSKDLFSERFNQFSILKNYFENQNFEMFEEVGHNSGMSDSDII